LSQSRANGSPRLREATMNPSKDGFALVVMGVSGSGKTTVAELLAKQLGWPFMEGDRLHPPPNVEKMRQGIPLTDADRGPWLDRIGEQLRSWAAEGTSGVLTCSALKHAYRDRIRSARPDVRFVYVRGSEPLIEARVAARHHEYMPASLLRSQFDTLEEPTSDEQAVAVDAGGSADEEVAAVIAALNLSPSQQS
jgi:gluconokinase